MRRASQPVRKHARSNVSAAVVSEAWRHFDALRVRWLGGSGSGAESDLPRGVLCVCERAGELWERVPRGGEHGVVPVGARLAAGLAAHWAAGAWHGHVTSLALSLALSRRLQHMLAWMPGSHAHVEDPAATVSEAALYGGKM